MAKKKNRSPASFRDCAYVMELALEKPGLQVRYSTAGRATHFKLRCNQFRALLRDQQIEMNEGVPGFLPETAFDLLVIRQVNEEGDSSLAGSIIQFDHEHSDYEIVDPSTGETFSIPKPDLDFGGPITEAPDFTEFNDD